MGGQSIALTPNPEQPNVTLAVDKLAWQRPTDRPCAISPSSWTATGAGPPSAACPAPKATARAWRAVRRTVEAAHRARHHASHAVQLLLRELARPHQEINDLFGLLRRFIRRDLADLHKNGVKISVIGTRARPRRRPAQADRRRRRAHQGQHRSQPHHRLQLRRPRRDRPRRAPHRRGRGRWQARCRRRHGGALRRLSRYRRSARPRPADPHERRAAFVAISCSGSSPIASSSSSTPIGLTSRAETLEAAIAEYQRRSRRFGGPRRDRPRDAAGTLPDSAARPERAERPESAMRVASAVVLAAFALGAVVC